MSGPIIRKYGFPNFEQIFGKRELEHGTEDESAPAPPKSEATPTPADPTKPPFGGKPAGPTQFGSAVE